MTRPLPEPPAPPEEGPLPEGLRVPLVDLAFARSGDKGDSASIGVAARSERAYEALRERLTPGFVRHVFREECKGEVVRYELPNLRAFNFVLKGALDGGGFVSLRSDPQGKTFAQRLVAAEITLSFAFQKEASDALYMKI